MISVKNLKRSFHYYVNFYKFIMFIDNLEKFKIIDMIIIF